MGLIIGEKRSVTIAILCLMLISSYLVVSSNGEIHKVGDSAGWTTIANVDYKQWALAKNFQIGDIIVFKYKPQFHNVMQVTHAAYKACNATSPISTHTTGNDSIAITTHGHHFFFCGVPGHCQAGQKVDINVLRAPSVAPTPSGSPPAVPTVSAPAPFASDAAHLFGTNISLGIACAVFIVIFFGLFYGN